MHLMPLRTMVQYFCSVESIQLSIFHMIVFPQFQQKFQELVENSMSIQWICSSQAMQSPTSSKNQVTPVLWSASRLMLNLTVFIFFSDKQNRQLTYAIHREKKKDSSLSNETRFFKREVHLKSLSSWASQDI